MEERCLMRRLKGKYDLSDIDKLEVSFAIKIPAKTKVLIDRLDKEQKKRLNCAILVSIAHVLHEADFDPTMYLKS